MSFGCLMLGICVFAGWFPASCKPRELDEFAVTTSTGQQGRLSCKRHKSRADFNSAIHVSMVPLQFQSVKNAFSRRHQPERWSLLWRPL